jgi:hypothetical protein
VDGLAAAATATALPPLLPLRCRQATTAIAFIFIVVIIPTTAATLLLPPPHCRRHSAVAPQGWLVILAVDRSVSQLVG